MYLLSAYMIYINYIEEEPEWQPSEPFLWRCPQAPLAILALRKPNKKIIDRTN